MLGENQIDFFKTQGYLVLPNLLNQEEVQDYLAVYDSILDKTTKNNSLRSDLSGSPNGDIGRERITQIMLPSTIDTRLKSRVLYHKTLVLAKTLLGNDMAFDFDMLINKRPKTNATTPWHQDEAYWIEMPDKRAISIWVALDHATRDNGCLWYVPKSHLKPLRKHIQKVKNGPWHCQASENEAQATPLKPGDCVMHQGGTIHYSRGNTTTNSRRAFILNYRPKSMVALERSQGFDHSRKRKNRRDPS
ncbi:MAG: phytanoyl-CoA dioxygenase family protein [Flavobacteriaceae bacterium]|nr:phytanoyl-CoA dioxygenase family protein [Flavobacteriaceae bacterium]MCY4217223.1 phytanoyl-CoA dioxygenase family protein [Flavobacteriaceae bacterium]